MTSIIKYVTGFPKDEEPNSERFEEVKKSYNLTHENDKVCLYRGPLTSDDFEALEGVLTSKQYSRIKIPINPEDKKRFLDIVRTSISGDLRLESTYYEDELKMLPKTSENFLIILEELLNHENATLSCADAEEYLLEQAKGNGLYYPISLSYPYKDHPCKKADGALAYNTRALVFIDEILRGDVTLKKTREYDDDWAGHTEEGIATINIEEQHINVKWNSWGNHNYLGWVIDPEIRKKILKEGEEERILVSAF